LINFLFDLFTDVNLNRFFDFSFEIPNFNLMNNFHIFNNKWNKKSNYEIDEKDLNKSPSDLELKNIISDIIGI